MYNDALAQRLLPFLQGTNAPPPLSPLLQFMPQSPAPTDAPSPPPAAGSFAPGLAGFLSDATPEPVLPWQQYAGGPAYSRAPAERVMRDAASLVHQIDPMRNAPVAPGGAASRVAPGPQTARTERFNWPVKTEYGKTVDMPITVNPSRGDIMRALAAAPHGDVRALRSPDGKIYMWPANEAMHRDIATNFDLPFKTREALQRASYLFNKKDVDALGKFSNFDDLIARLGAGQ